MKIVFLSRHQDKISRGAENFVIELSKRLSINHQVEILSGNDADNISKVIKGDYDIVIPINGRTQSLKASLGRIFGGYKLLITGHSGIGRDDIWNIAVCKPDVFVALTEYMLSWAKGWAWGSKIIKIPNGIDLNKFRPEGEKIKLDLPRPIILSVGALVWYKYHDRVIKVIKELGSGSLLIVGKGEMQEELENLGQELLPNRFKILNFRYEDMPKVYRSCDLFTLPSWDREAFGLVYLEAMASGLGVVAPDDETRHEIVGSGGLFMSEKNYAEVLKIALSMKWRDKAREQAERFSWEKVANQYENVMIDMLKK